MIFIFYRARAVQGVLLWLIQIICRIYNPFWGLWVGQVCFHKAWDFLEELVAE